MPRLKPEEWFPAGVDGIAVRRLSLASGIGVRVLEAGPAEGEPLLLLHGWAVSAYLWRHNILPLTAQGHRVVAVDLPGHGLSDAPIDGGRAHRDGGEGAGYTLAAFSRWTQEILDALGWERATIAAQSMAGKIAVRVALDAPRRVRQLLLFGPVGFGLIPPWQVIAPFVPTIPGPLPALLVPRRIVAVAQARVRGRIGAPPTERDVDEYWAPTQFADVVRAQLRMLKEFAWEPWEEGTLRGLEVPTQVYFGTRDGTVRPRMAQQLVAVLSRGRLAWVRDGGHVLMEEVPEWTNREMLANLRAGE